MDGFAELIQIAIDFGIPFYKIPQTVGEQVYLAQTVIWVTFILGIFLKGLGKLMGSMLGGVR